MSVVCIFADTHQSEVLSLNETTEGPKASPRRRSAIPREQDQSEYPDGRLIPRASVNAQRRFGKMEAGTDGTLVIHVHVSKV